MTEYKRNQIEDALSRTLGEQSVRLSLELRTRVKRLLDMDRRLGQNARSRDPAAANYAFYSSDAPGKGNEVKFSDYEAFALLTGLRLLRHGWPQSFPVALLRQLRPELEREHGRILRQDRSVLFDEKRIRDNARIGDLAFDNTDPVFLLIASGQKQEDGARHPPSAVCRGIKQVSEFMKKEPSGSWSWHELVTPAHSLLSELTKVQPRKRGRSS
jgi:hypothetical protein